MHRVQDHMTDFKSLDVEHEMLLAPNAACHSVPMGILISPKSTDEEGSGNPEQERPPSADLMQSCILLRINSHILIQSISGSPGSPWKPDPVDWSALC